MDGNYRKHSFQLDIVGTVYQLVIYDGWNFNFGNIPLDWIQELPGDARNAAGRMGPSPTHVHNGSGPSRNGHMQ